MEGIVYMNKGEWSEAYVALKLLGDQKMYMIDEEGNMNLSEWINIRRLVGKATKERQVSYICKTNEDEIVIEVNGRPITCIKVIEFQDKAERLKNDILSGKNGSFNVSAEVEDF